MSTQEQRRQWRELADAATPGNYFYRGQYIYSGTVLVCVIPIRDNSDADAAFIAAAPAAVPALLADVDALTQEVTRLMEAGRDMQEQRDGWRQECEQARAELASYKRNAAYISSVIDSEGKYVP